jgi:4-diphosphocytidyl-2-C-methyl-D-erythritol kinase
MVFADIGDRLELTPTGAWSFQTLGPFAGEIGPGENLVERAAQRLCQRAGVRPLSASLTLTKALPVAAGLGGGSSDAGAALRLLNAALPEPLPDGELERVAAELGADGPACLHARPVLAEGVGDRLRPAPRTPPLPVVLVNPRRPSPTGGVYRAYDAGPAAEADMPPLPATFDSVQAVACALRSLRNDLEAPAAGLEPAIGEALELLQGSPEVLLARMSGSGATSFALCSTGAAARSVAARVRELQPEWWVEPALCSPPDTRFTNS